MPGTVSLAKNSWLQDLIVITIICLKGHRIKLPS